VWLYSIFLPLSLGTTWFYVGLFIYLLGWIFLVLAMLVFVATPVDKPNTTGIYRFSRHPWYLGMFFIYIGAGVASASWLYLLITFSLLAIYRNAFLLPEERFCCEKFADAYREYMDSTPRWLGIPKSRIK
jgi:protein-S-isoprenylcysteine O-methyltransferase Ste14